MENDLQKINPTCLLCNGRGYEYKEKSGYKIYKCSSCRTLFIYPLPTLNIATQVYGEDYFDGATKGHGYVAYDEDKQAMKEVFSKHLQKFEKILGKKGKLFDIGAATGYFMRLAKERGWSVKGIDISAYATALARKKYGLDMLTGVIGAEKIEQNDFDVVTMWDVIEHVANPKADLQVVNKMLKTGGLLAINTPDAGSFYARLMGSRWHLFVPPEHIWYLNRQSLRDLLEKSGFEVLHIGCIGKKFTIEYIFSMLHRWQRLVIWKKLADTVRNTSFGTFSIPINLYDNMYVLARKK